MSISVVTQRQSIAFNGSVISLKMLLDRIGGPGTVETIEPDVKFKIFNSIDITVDGKLLIMEWEATPITDMYADTVVASLMQTELVGNTIKATTSGNKSDRLHFKECLVETLQDMFGDNSVPNSTQGDDLFVTVNNKQTQINLESLVGKLITSMSTVGVNCFFHAIFQDVKCEDDDVLEETISVAVKKLHSTLVQGTN